MIPGFTSVDMGPGIFAGFTARAGGISTHPYATLNLGPNVGDQPQAVANNRRIVAQAVGRPIAYAEQIHSDEVLVLDDDSPWYGSETPPIAVGKADGLVTANSRLGLGVLVADCVPILLASDAAIAIAHAGRRGIELGVIAQVVAQLRGLSGDGEVRAAIGPAICGQCYEVPDQMQAEVCQISPEAFATTRWGTPGLDLPAAAAAQLAAAGAVVRYQSTVCTFTDESYYSHRRASATGETTGRQAGIIARQPSDLPENNNDVSLSAWRP